MMPKISLFWHRFHPASHLCKTGQVLKKKKKKKKKNRLFHLESIKWYTQGEGAKGEFPPPPEQMPNDGKMQLLYKGK